MGLSLSGDKSKKKESSTFQQTNNTTLSDRANSMIGGGIAGLQQKQYRAYDPASAQQFMNPFQQQVIDASLAQSDQTDAVARAQQQSDFGKSGAFGDNRRGIYEAQLAGDQSRNRASMIAGLNAANYGQAQAAALGENQNFNTYDAQTQDFITRLLSLYGNETNQTQAGSGTGKSSGYSLGFSFAPPVPGAGK